MTDAVNLNAEELVWPVCNQALRKGGKRNIKNVQGKKKKDLKNKMQEILHLVNSSYIAKEAVFTNCVLI